MTYRQAAITSPIQSESLSYHQAQNSYPGVIKLSKALDIEWVYTPTFTSESLFPYLAQSISYLSGSLYIVGGAGGPHLIRVTESGETKEWLRSSPVGGFAHVTNDGTDIYVSATTFGTSYRLESDNSIQWSRANGLFTSQRFFVNGSYFYGQGGKYNISDGSDYALASGQPGGNGNAVADGSYVWFAGRTSNAPTLTKHNDDSSLGKVWTYTGNGSASSLWIGNVAVDNSEAYFLYGNGGASWVEEISSGGSSNWDYKAGS